MIIVRVHDNEHATTHVIRAFPCLIGRSAQCHVRVDDPSVSARHARIDQMDTGYVLQDLGSTNGILHRGSRVAEVTLDQNETVTLGDVRVELVVQEKLEKTLQNRRLDTEPELPAIHLALRTLLALGLGYVALMFGPAAKRYLEFWPPERPQDIFADAFVSWSMLAAVAFVISLFCKLNSRRFHYHRVFALLVVTVVAAGALSLLLDLVIFNLHNIEIAHALPYLAFSALTFGFMYRLQKYGFARWSARARALIALGFALLAILVAYVMSLSSRGYGERTAMDDLSFALVDPRGISETTSGLTSLVAESARAADKEGARERERLSD